MVPPNRYYPCFFLRFIFSDNSTQNAKIMNPALFGVVIIAAQILVALALLFVAGSLIRIELNLAEAANSHFDKRPARFIRDLRGLEDALVEFFARSTEAYLILSVLVAYRKPLRLATIAQEVQREKDRCGEADALPMSIAWPVLCILQVSGLVRLSRHGFLVTEVGREVYGRIEGNSAVSAEDHATYHSSARTLRDQSCLTRDQPAMLPLYRRTENLKSFARKRIADSNQVS
jgi:hypothetical protein